RLAPGLAAGRAREGLADFGTESFEIPLAKVAHIAAFQDDAEHFSVTSDGHEVKSGKHLGGWLAMEDAEGRGVGICLRHAWQMFPSALAVDGGELRVALWPAAAGRMGFEYADIMPPDFYNKAEWKNFPWSKDKGHFEHEF